MKLIHHTLHHQFILFNNYMKVQIRKNVFETNSSSTHSLVICSKDLYDKFINNEAVFDNSDYKIVEINDEIRKVMDGSSNYRYYTADRLFEEKWEYLESFEENYTTESGDKIVVFGAGTDLSPFTFLQIILAGIPITKETTMEIME